MQDNEIDELIERLSDAGTGQAGTLQEELCWDAATALRQLQAENKALKEEKFSLCVRARSEIEEWAAYASEYFQKKHGLHETLAWWGRAALQQEKCDE